MRKPPLTYEAAQYALAHLSPTGWWVRLRLPDRGRRGIGHLAIAVLKTPTPKGAWVRFPNHKRDEFFEWSVIEEWISRNPCSVFSHPGFLATLKPQLKAPPPVPPPVPSSPPVEEILPPPPPAPLPEPPMSTPPAPEPKAPLRNFLSRVLARKAEDALLALSKDPSFPTLSRQAIAEHLTAKIECPITVGNLKNLAEAVEVKLPDSRSPSSSTPISEIRLSRLEDAMSFLLRHLGGAFTSDARAQLEVVRASWLSHLTTVRTPED